MTTLSGGPRPNDFKDDDVLTAALFKEATQFWVADDVPSDSEGKDGDVVFVLKEEELGGGGSAELPGLGGWAEITDVSGSPKRYAYPDPANPEWVAFEWTDTSKTHTLTTQAGGLVDALLVGGGIHYSTNPAYGGRVNAGLISVSQSNTVTVGVLGAPPGISATNTSRSAITETDSHALIAVAQSGENYAGTWTANYAWGAAGEALVDSLQGVKSSITGPEVEYGKGYNGTNANNGEPGSAGPNGSDGAVVIRVPAAQAEKVPSGSWVTRSNHFAVVENGVVTETYTEHHYGNGTTTPLPQTDLIPCDANVTEGYSYENGEFVSPPAPEIPAAQQKILDKVNKLQQDLEKLTK